MRRLAPYLFRHRRTVIIAFGAAIAGQTVAALTPVVQKIIVDDVIINHRRPLAPWLVALLVAGVIRFATAYLRRFFGGRLSLDVQYDLRTEIFEKLQRLDFARHDEMQTGQLVSRASSDVGLLQGLLAFLPIVSANVVMLVIAFVVMFSVSPLLALATLAVAPLILVVALQLRTSVYPASWDAQQKAADVAGVVEEAVTGVRVVKGFGQEDRELGHLVGAAEDLYASRLRVVRLTARKAATLQALPSVGQVAILALGGWLAIHHRLSLGGFLLFSSYLLEMVSPMRMLAGITAIASQARAGTERIFELLDSVPTVTERPDAVVLGDIAGDIVFDDVSFGYLRTEPVLAGLSLHVRPGETVALVGGSGSGKSTVALLLPRFYDVQSGTIRLDGVDVRDATLDSLRRRIGVVFEESFLFSDSVRANIAYGRPTATDAEVEAAARAAEAHDFIAALPGGYETVVGERGLTLSGGQRQRVALARALITDPQVLILDDATSSVDSRVEEEIHSTLRRLMQGRTTLLVAHRRSTLRLADRIVVVDHGRVIDQGIHDELLARCREYRLLLAGPGDDAEGLDVEKIVTADAWATSPGDAPRPRSSAAAAPSMGFGVGGGGGGGANGAGWMGMLPPTPELLARVAALPAPADRPRVDIAAEVNESGPFSLRRFIRPYRRPLLLGAVLVVLDTLATLAGPALVRQGLDHGVLRGSQGALWTASFALLVVVLLDWVDSIAVTLVTGKTAERLLFALRARIFAHLQRLALDYYDREMAGRVMTRMTTDVEALANLLQTGLINALVALLSFFGVAGALLYYNTRLALVALTVVPPLALATWWFRSRSRFAYDQARERIAIVNANLQESLSGVRVAQAYVREDRNESEFRRLSGNYLESRLSAQRLVALYFPFVEFLSEVAAAAVLAVGMSLVRSGSLTTGELIAFLLYLNLLFSPIQQLSQVFDAYQQARASMSRITELMATPVLTPAAESPCLPGRVRGDIRLEGVRFRYPGTAAAEEALRGVDLTVAAGETVALVGETGAGKSTIVKLVARFYDPTAGRVLIDGVPLAELDLGSYRRQLGYVPQEAFLFTGTIRDNIAYGRPSATDAEVEAAARAVGAHAFVAGLPGGYLHPVAEKGRSLSSGQRQLIALARAQLVDPAILLLDEATSNLDLGTEARVARAMGVVASGRTTLLIAHRLQTARAADRILVLDGGRVVQTGSHDELVADLSGPYAQMWRAFAEAVPEPG